MKKLLFIHHRLVCGGAENALFSLLKLLNKEKYEITVFTLQDGGEWDSKFCDAGFRVIHSYSGLIQGRRIHNLLRRIRIERARRRKGKGLIRAAVGEKFDLVVAYHLPAAFGNTGQNLKAAKIRYIHGDAEQDSVLRNNLLETREMLIRQNRIICVSDRAKQAFVELVGIRQNVSVCFNPIDGDEIIAAAHEAQTDIVSLPYICAVGRLSQEKGFERLIRIHKHLRDEGLEHGLVIVGDGPQREKLDGIIEELGVRDSVTLTGYRENPYGYMKNSLFTVCSSFTEGLPVTAMESLCLGVPIVSAYPSVEELFGQECCGIITENDDASLEAGIRKMLTDAEYYAKAVNGAGVRSAAFSPGAMIEKVEQIFDAVMEEERNDS